MFDTLSKLGPTPYLSAIRPFHFSQYLLNGVDTIVSRTGYTGEDGFELWFDAGYAEKIWNDLMEAGREYDITPCGLGARNTLRLEAGMCLYGHELTEEVTPLMAGLDRWVKLEGDDFIGRDAIQKRGREKLLTGFMAEGTGPTPRGDDTGHDPIFDEIKRVGEVASGSYSPTLKSRIGTAFLQPDLARDGIMLQAQVKRQLVDIRTHKLPFYHRPKIAT